MALTEVPATTSAAALIYEPKAEGSYLAPSSSSENSQKDLG